MSTITPTVSIGMPVYNAANYIEQTIESILVQTFTDFELIISDNCSTDETPQIVKRFMARDKRIRYHRNQQNIGANRNFNLVATMGRGKYFKWSAHDDLIKPTYLERCVALLETDEGIVLAHCNTQLIDQHGEELTPPNNKNYIIDDDNMVIYLGKDSDARLLESMKASDRYHAIIMETNWCYEIFGVIRKNVLRTTDLLLSFYGADKLLLGQLAMMGRFAIVPEKLFLNRRHPAQSMSNLTIEGQEEWTDPSTTHSSLQHRWLRLKGQLLACFYGRNNLQESFACLMVVVRYYVRFKRIRNMFLEVTGIRVWKMNRELQKRQS